MKRVLVINPFGIGDAIFSMGLVESLREAHPGIVIGFLCNERTVDLVRLNVSIDQTFVFHRDLFRRLWKKHPILFFKKLKALLKMVREHQFDTALDLSLGREYSFFCRWVGIKKRIGFDYKGRGVFLTDKTGITGYEGRAVTDIQLDLLEDAGISVKRGHSRLPIKVSPSIKNEIHNFLKKKGSSEGERLVALAPGGGKSWGENAVYKQWGPERFAEAMNRFSSGSRVRAVLLGDKAEESLLKQTASFLKVPSIVVAGEEIEKVCALLLKSDFLCCNDGGLLHLANSLGVKTVSIFGPVDEKVYGPYGNETFHEVVTEPVSCRPCYHNFSFPPCPHERRCLKDLSVDKVVTAMKKIA